MEKVVKKNPNLLTNAKDVIVETETTDDGKKKGITLDEHLGRFPGCKAEKTTNGFVIKFPNGFIIQGHKINVAPTNVAQNNAVWTGILNLGNWDIPFTNFLYASANIVNAPGDRSYWLSCYKWGHNPSATSCGKIVVNETWNGLSNGVDILSVGYGYWK